MAKETVQFTVRLNPETARKLAYVAEYYGRSQNQEIAWLARQAIIEFEREHGEIESEDK